MTNIIQAIAASVGVTFFVGFYLLGFFPGGTILMALSCDTSPCGGRGASNGVISQRQHV